jgi:hypothetical protein
MLIALVCLYAYVNENLFSSPTRIYDQRMRSSGRNEAANPALHSIQIGKGARALPSLSNEYKCARAERAISLISRAAHMHASQSAVVNSPALTGAAKTTLRRRAPRQ